MSCIFCDIAKHEVPSAIEFEDADVVAFKDIHPIAPVHLLIVPTKHYADLNGLKVSDQLLFGKIVRIASELAAKHKITGGWQLFARVGKGGGQDVPHVHFHLVSGSHC